MITKLLEKLNINEYELYGNDMAKINIDYNNKKIGKTYFFFSRWSVFFLQRGQYFNFSKRSGLFFLFLEVR